MPETLRLIVQPNEPGVFLEVPEAVVLAFGAGKRPAVTATVNGHQHRTRIAVYGGHYYLAFRKDAREAAALEPGDEVDVTLALDDEPRDITPPDDLVAILDADPEARTSFEALSFTNRKEYVSWLEGAKRRETRQRRLDQVAALLKTGHRTPAGRV